MTLSGRTNPPFTSKLSAIWPIALLLIAFFANALLWAFVVLPYWGPDEGSHYEYINYVATHRTLPIYGQTSYVYDPHRLQVHASQPPLYYLLETPVYWILSGTTKFWQLMGMRMVSITLGTLTVGLIYILGRQLFPTRRGLAVAMAAFVGFMPMFTYMSAVVNSDNLINLIFVAWLNWLVYGLKRAPTRGWLIGLGVLLGIGLITKYSIVPAFFVSAIALVYLAYRTRKGRIRLLITFGLWVGVPVLLISGWMFVRNLLLYGDLINAGRMDINEWNPYSNTGTLFSMIFDTSPTRPPFMPTLYQSFAGVFDYMDGYMPAALYYLFGAILLVGIVGAILAFRHLWHIRLASPDGFPLFRIACLLLLGVAAFLFVCNYSYSMDYQPQGRYLFIALAPLAVVMVAGWEDGARRLGMSGAATPTLIVLMVAINVLALMTTLAPLEHDRYLRTVASNPLYVPEEINDTNGVSIPFTASQPEVSRLDVLLNVPTGYQGNISWQIRRGGETLASAITRPSGNGLGLYRLHLPAEMNFRPNGPDTLTLRSLETSAVLPSIYALQGNQRTLTNTADLGLQVIYPVGADAATLQRLTYLLRSGPLVAERTTVQLILYPVALICLIVFTAPALLALRMWRWRGGLVLLVVVLIIVVCATQTGMSDARIPHYNVTALAGP